MSSFCLCLSVGSICLEGINWMYFLEPFQDSVSRSIRSPSDLLTHKVLIKTVQVQQLAIKILIDSGVGFKDSKGKNKAILTILS